MEKEILQRQDNGWKTYYTIPASYEDACEFFKSHPIIGKHFPDSQDDFSIEMHFILANGRNFPGWFLRVKNRTKQEFTEFHVYRHSLDEGEPVYCDMRKRPFGLIAKWTNWDIIDWAAE